MKNKTINSKLLDQYIQQSGFNYSEICDMMEISRCTLHNIISEKNNPSHDVIMILAKTLKFNEDQFINVFFPHIKFKESR